MKKPLLLALLLLAWAAPASAQVAADASAEHQNNNDGSAVWNHTVAGSNRFLLVACTLDELLTWTTVTADGVSLGTPIVNANPNREITIWGLVAPNTGTISISIAWSNGNREPYCISSSWTGVDQATPYDTPAAPTDAGGTSSSQVVTSATNDRVVDWMVNGGSITGFTPGAGQTELQQQVGGASTNNMGSSHEAGAASVTMSWSWTGSVAYNQWTMNLNADGGGGGGGGGGCPGMLLRGVCEE